MQKLIDKVGILNYKYEILNQKTKFNIFSILRNKSDEVHLHSKFIFELLENHQEDYFLSSFLDIIGIDNNKDTNYKIYRELKNIDILLLGYNNAIIIENKIYADDQPKQLQRYHEYVKSLKKYSKIHIFYLTLDGHEPSEQSRGYLDLKDIKLLSYNFEIKKWIEKCIELSCQEPLVRETLVQYKNLIKELTGESMSNEQNNEILDLILENDNITKAYSIAQNWSHVKWHTEFNFWEDFYTKIKNEYTVLDLQLYSESDLNSVIHNSRNRWPWYGIMIKIANYKKLDMCLYIERGKNEVYYFLVLIDSENERVNDTELSEKMKGVFGDPSTGYFGGNLLEPTINFESFSDENTLKISNKLFRKEYIDIQWERIKTIIEEIKIRS